MSNIIDPGANAKTAAEAKAARLKGWKRPSKKEDRDALRADRIARKGVVVNVPSVQDDRTG